MREAVHLTCSVNVYTSVALNAQANSLALLLCRVQLETTAIATAFLMRSQFRKLREVQLPFWDQRARTMCCGCVTHPRVRSHTKPVAHFGCTFGLSSGLWCITVAAPRVACRPTIPTGGRQMWSEACTILHSLRLGSITIESGCIPKLKGALVRWAMWLLPGMAQRGDA